MASQTRDSNRNEYPVYEPKKVINKDESYSLDLSNYPILPTQTLSKCSSVSASNSMRHAIENVSDRLLLNFPLALSQRLSDQGHTSTHASRQKSKRSEGVRIRKLIRVKSTKFEKSKGFRSEAAMDEDIIPVNNEYILNASLTRKYQPKVFSDIAGHEITILAISKAVEKTKIASLYLFHGPTGTGKTSTARIFAMALNCEINSAQKPCWSCRGCSRSLFIMDLCSGNKSDGFEKIKTLLESTSFARAIPGFKVLIIKQCHLLNGEDWDELLGMAERAYEFGVVFVIVTFPLTCSLQVGLVPQNKLLDVLKTAMSGDAMKTMRYTKELIATGVEPHLLVSQLAGLVSDVLSDDTVVLVLQATIQLQLQKIYRMNV